ncbi:dienelactone hydrolase family protein [Alteromonadaceae bacterium BrNp21-10]|nr:dienelactone hydrolase family protein [Alteromonadaceae bacterium BrNp21-10]
MTDNTLQFVDVNPTAPAAACVIWLHGLGDSGNGFAPIVPELHIAESLNIRFVFPHAPVRPVTINNGMPMRAWYDIKSMELDKRADATGVRESADLVEALILQEIAAGIPANKIVLAGFSQGGVIALHLGTRFNQQLAGIMALSTYMSEPDTLTNEASEANKSTPILMCHGRMDDVVPMTFGRQALNQLEANHYPVEWHDYPMQHNVCAEEILKISQWLQSRLG